jgi:hypothetical protein
MRTLFTLSIVLTTLIANAQNPSADYQRLSTATRNAFSVAERQYTYKIENRSSSGGTTTSSSSSSSTGSSGISGDYNSYPAINVNKRHLEQQAEARARQESRIMSFEAKMERVDNLIRERGLQRSPEFHAALVQAAMDGGLNSYEASRFFGSSPEEYREMLVSKNAADYRWRGGVKGDCQGDCTENLTSEYGFTYSGNAKYGKPHGKGVMISESATYKGDFLAGEPNGEIDITWSSGGRFIGTTWNAELIKGELIQNGSTYRGTFLNGSYYRGLMKVQDMEILGEFNSTPSVVYGMKAYSDGETIHGFYSGKDEDPTYYQLKITKAGHIFETIYDQDDKAFGDVRYYNNGSVFYTMPDEDNLRLCWIIEDDGTAYYAYLDTDLNTISEIQNLSEGQLAYLKQKMELLINELERRRDEYKDKMELVHLAIQ